MKTTSFERQFKATMFHLQGLDVVGLPSPSRSSEFSEAEEAGDRVPLWPIVGLILGMGALAAIGQLDLVRAPLLRHGLGDFSTLIFINVAALPIAMAVAVIWLTLEVRRTRALIKSLKLDASVEDRRALEVALKGRWFAAHRALLLGLLATIRTEQGRLSEALETYGSALHFLGGKGPRKLREVMALSLTHALAKAGKCDDAQRWAEVIERQLPARAGETFNMRVLIAFHRGDLGRVLSLTQAVSAWAGPREARALRAFALAQSGEGLPGRHLAATLAPARNAEFASTCFASSELKRFLLECGLEPSAIEPI
jgi:hypothetical protein